MSLFNTSTSTLSKAEQIARLRLIRTDGIGPITFRHLLSRFVTAERAVEEAPVLAARGGKKKPMIIADRKKILHEMNKLNDLGAYVLHLGCPDYPARLGVLEDAPPVLFAQGNPHLLEKDTIGIVGSRNASAAGLRLTSVLAAGLSDKGIIIASGLARGIDTAAHKPALKGGTIACIAGGLDIIYPPENEALQEAIAKRGVILSEMPLGTKPQARHFPRRNRLISGISLGILVVEAADKSGSLITARCAAEQGREVFAVPGSPLDPRSNGTNRLIKDGAILVRGLDDITNELASIRLKPFDEDEDVPLFNYNPMDYDDIQEKDRNTIEMLLSNTPTQIDEIIRHANMEAGTVHAILLEFELAGRAIRYPGGRVCLAY